MLTLYKKVLENIFDRDDHLKRDEIQKLKTEIERIELRKSNLQNRFLDGDITPQDYQDMKGEAGWILRPKVYHLFHSIVYQRFAPKFTTWREGYKAYFTPKFTT